QMIHPYLATLTALPATDEDRSALGVQIGFAQRERLADPQSGAPEHDDQAAKPEAVGIITSGAHDRDDLLNCWRVGWVAQALVARRMTHVKARQCGWRTAAPCA